MLKPRIIHFERAVCRIENKKRYNWARSSKTDAFISSRALDKEKNWARDERVCKSLSLSNWRTGITEMFLIEIIRANIIIIIFF